MIDPETLLFWAVLLGTGLSKSIPTSRFPKFKSVKPDSACETTLPQTSIAASNLGALPVDGEIRP